MAKTRGLLIAGNWKMNGLREETHRFFQDLQLKPATVQKMKAASPENLRGALHLPALSLIDGLQAAGEFKSRNGTEISIGAQNAHWEVSGAFTGEISGPMLLERGIRSTLIAHSERRQFFGETNATAKKRTESLLKQNIQVIHCIGESESERKSGQTEAVLKKQLLEGLPEPSLVKPASFVLAYEPVWAIGTGLTATTEQAEGAHQIIRQILWDVYGFEMAAKLSILYGGSVKPDNVRALMGCANIDGALVGGASLKAKSFAELLDESAALL